MGYIYELESKHYSTLLAAGELNIVDREVNNMVGEGTIPPDTHNRTILIGLGGAGVQTVNHIKRVISGKLAPSWKNYIAFLAIDADDNEFDNATYLTEEEFVRTPKPISFQTTVLKGKAAYPKAWIPFADEFELFAMFGCGNSSAVPKRIAGKMQIHAKLPDSRGVDEEIVVRLADLKNNVLEKFAPRDNGHYEVYVIGSVSGGTCSGGFLEMPALIRKALNADPRTRIHAMLYLPDTLTAMHIEYANEPMANGYAALKELDYYEGLNMRWGTEETFYYNDPASPELKLSSANDFFTMPYLVGTKSGATSNSKDEACETIAEFFISILGRMVPPGQNAFMIDSFLHIAPNRAHARYVAEGNENLEADGADHSRPKRYGAVGFAQATVPEQIVKAYTIAQVCKNAGLEPISEPERAARIAAGEILLPFCGEDQLFSAREVNDSNNELMASLKSYMQKYLAAKFSYASAFGAAPTWDEIREGNADDMGRARRVDHIVNELTDAKSIRQLQQEVRAQFAQFRARVKAYVKQNGPMAFVNLYEGNAEKDENGPRAIGIREMLNAMRDDLNPATQTPNIWPSEFGALEAKDKADREISILAGSFIDWAKNLIAGKKAEQVTDWVNAYNAWVNIRISNILRKSMLGTNGILYKHFIGPANMLCQQLYAFGKLLTAMYQGYAACGSVLNNYDEFAGVSGGSARVNIAGLNYNVHAYLKQKAKRSAGNVNAAQVRNALIDSFFEDPDKWMVFDENAVERRGGGTQLALVNSNSPIGARYEFDRCLRQAMPTTMEIRVEELFAYSGMDPDEFASQVVRALIAKSSPLFHGDLTVEDTRRCIVYPQSLDWKLKVAIENAARNMVDPSISFYGTGYADAIMMYQLVAPFEMYKLAELKTWEKAYLDMKHLPCNGLHGRSPDLVRKGSLDYEERTPWFDYPAITYDRDPKRCDASTGEISHEGIVRLEMDKVIKEARKKGILYSHSTYAGLVIKRVHLDRSIDWSFDIDLLTPDEETGLMPEGKELLEEIIKQNRKKLADVSKVVRLAYAGLLSKEHSDEKWAWEYASRVLYAHRPMFAEICDTLELTRGWYDAIDAMNINIKKSLNPAKMYRLLQAGILSQNEKGMWVFRDDRGAQVAIASMNPAKLELLRDSKPKESAIVDTGLNLFYLFDQLMKRITDKELDEALDRATETLNDDEYLESEEFINANKMARTMLAAELEIVNALGADLENCSEPASGFVDNLRERGLCCGEKPLEITRFYSRIRLWGSM